MHRGHGLLFFADTRAVEKIAFRVYIEGMRRNEVIARLKQTEPALKAFGWQRFTCLDRMRAMRPEATRMWMSSSIRLPTVRLVFCR